MPLIFYGTLGLNRQRLMFTENLRAMESNVFEYLKLEDLAPYRAGRHIANFWHVYPARPTVHSCFAWHDDRDIEQSVYIPGAMNWREALILAREAFPTVMPSAITFRVNNHKRAYTYD